MDNHHEHCDGGNCEFYLCPDLGAEQLQQRVIDLWLGNDCWIPGADYKRLAEALGVDPDRLQNDRTRGVHERMAERKACREAKS